MDIRTKFTLNIPEALIKALGITEDTLFIVKYESGELTLEPINNHKTESIAENEEDIDAILLKEHRPAKTVVTGT